MSSLECHSAKTGEPPVPRKGPTDDGILRSLQEQGGTADRRTQVPWSRTRRRARGGGPGRKEGLFARFKRGLKRTAQLLNTDIRDLFKQEGRLVDDDFLRDLFAILIRTDMGTGPADAICEQVRTRLPRPRRQDGGRSPGHPSQTPGIVGPTGTTDRVCRIRPDRDHGRGRQRIGQDHLDRQAGPHVPRPGQAGDSRRGRHVPGGGRRAVDGLGRARRRRNWSRASRAAIRPASPIARSPGRWRAGRTSASSTPRAGCRPRPT